MQSRPEQAGTLVIGAGQAGLSVGYYLARRGLPFVILDANQRIGDAWRNRWDSLHLFTPARYDALPGMPFPAPGQSFPTKDEMADYLQAYATRFKLPVNMGIQVTGVSRRADKYVVTTADHEFEAKHVVVAMSRYQEPSVPPFAAQLNRNIVQLHSSEYRNPKQLKPGAVLIVGAGNSGAEIAKDVSRDHPTWMSGRGTGHIPFRIDGLAARLVLQRLIFRVVFHRLLTNDTPMGRKARQKMLSQGGPLIRVKPNDLAAMGVKRIPRVVGTRDGLPCLEDGQVLGIANVIWCTGFQPGFSWINLPVFDEQGMPKHERGVVRDEPGLYFVGLPFIRAFSSGMIHGVGRDAEHIVKVIDARIRVARSSAEPERETPKPSFDSNEPTAALQA